MVVPGGKRIVLTTFGSLGDLHPFIALALELRNRGHEPVLCTLEMYREKIETLNLRFHPLRAMPPQEIDTELMKQAMDLRRGPEFIIRKLLMPSIQTAYEDTFNAAATADLLVSHSVTFATPLVAEKKGIPWASCVLQPSAFFSVQDPPVLAPARFLNHLRFLGPSFYGSIFRLLKWSIGSWTRPVHQLRADIGLKPTRNNPLIEGQHSPFLVLALFSRWLAQAQSDWPKQTLVTGFPFFDQDGEAQLDSGLKEFLGAGPAPIVFTLGSSAVMDPGSFFERSLEAAKRLGQRAVLLVGKKGDCSLSRPEEGILACPYAPFSLLFPQASALVHQGGVGTTGQALQAGRPMLVMPFSHDQPDNAERICRLGVGRMISRSAYTTSRAARELKFILDNPSYFRKAADVGEQIRQENGVATACDALEKLL